MRSLTAALPEAAIMQLFPALPINHYVKKYAYLSKALDLDILKLKRQNKISKSCFRNLALRIKKEKKKLYLREFFKFSLTQLIHRLNLAEFCQTFTA